MFRRRERDPLPGSKVVGQNRHQFNIEAKKWFILICLSMTISVMLFPNILTRPKIYKLGDVADRDIKALREFLVENTELTEKKRQEAVKTVPFVYDFDPSGSDIASRVNEAFELGKGYVAHSKSLEKAPKNDSLKVEKSPENQITDIDFLKQRFFEILDIPLDEKIFDTFFKSDFSAEAKPAIIDLISQVLKKGVVSNKAMLMSQSGKEIILHDILTEKEINVTELDRFYNLKAAEDFIEGQSKDLKNSIGSRSLTKASIKLASTLIKPNVTFNKRETELRKDLAREAVSPFYFKIKKDEMLVREGERIKPGHLLKISEQNKFLKQKEMLGRAPAMTALIGFLLITMYLVGFLGSRSTKAGLRDLLFNSVTLVITFLLAVASNFVASEIARGFHFFTSRALIFAIPVAGGAMLVSIFQGIGVAAGFSLIISVLASLIVGGNIEFFVYFFVSSLLAAYGVVNCRERSVFIKTGLKVSAINMALVVPIEALHGSFYSWEMLIAIASAFTGGFFAGVIATGILPIIEMSFNYSSDIKLLELASLDQPLLRELMVQAPGTYHHSVIVSNMVEATAEAVNANPLLAKVAAYYHDIGKIKKPLYFVENQLEQENKHEKLAPSMSSLILISHIKDGVELAKEYKLGSEITNIIRQHHGTSLISFFYEKAKKEQAEKKGGKSLQVKELDFRYPGPKPQTKEAGLVMLADAVEAASKTITDPTAARIQGMVQKIINKVFSDGQLDECELTLKDLHEIAKSFNKTLSGIFHHRVEYPESATKDGPGKKGVNGDTDQRPTEDSRAGKSEDKTDTGDSLKRLGLS